MLTMMMIMMIIMIMAGGAQGPMLVPLCFSAAAARIARPLPAA